MIDLDAFRAVHPRVYWLPLACDPEIHGRHDVPKLGLQTLTPDGETMLELARRVLGLSAAGLSARARINDAGDNEGGFLDPLRDVLATGQTPADRLLARYHGEWAGDVSHIYEEFSF